MANIRARFVFILSVVMAQGACTTHEIGQTLYNAGKHMCGHSDRCDDADGF